MLTYPLSKESGRSLYEQLYEGIRRDILSGTLPAHQRLPSKRALAQHLEVSIITVQNAYEQLAAEGYIYSQEKRGYYVSPWSVPCRRRPGSPAPLPPEPEQKTYFLDLVTNSIDRAYFPFTVWARLMRRRCWSRDKALLQAAPYNGAEELRRAISDYLRQFRGMNCGQRPDHRRRRYGVSVFAADPAAGPGEVLRRGGPRIQQNCGNLPQPSGGSAAGGTG